VIIISFKVFRNLLYEYEERNRVEVSLEDVKRSIDNIDQGINEIVEKTKKGDYDIPETIKEIEGLLFELKDKYVLLARSIKLSTPKNIDILQLLSEFVGGNVDSIPIPRSIAPYNYYLDESLDVLDILQLLYYKTFHSFKRKGDIGKKDLIIIKKRLPDDDFLLKHPYIYQYAILELNKKTRFYDYICFATAFRQKGIIESLKGWENWGKIVREILNYHIEELLAYGKLYADLTSVLYYLYKIYKDELKPFYGFNIILSIAGKPLDEVSSILSRGMFLKEVCLTRILDKYLTSIIETYIKRLKDSGNNYFNYVDDNLKKSIEDSIKGIAGERMKLENYLKNDMKEKYNFQRETLLTISKYILKDRDSLIQTFKKLFMKR
jgi:hypothetical protein